MNLTAVKRMSVPWETPVNLSSTGVRLLLNYTCSSVIFQKMDSVPTRLGGWWEWVRQRDSTVSLAPFLSQMSTFNLLWKKETKNWTDHHITLMLFRCLPLQPSMFGAARLWMMGIRIPFGQRRWGGYLAIWCFFFWSEIVVMFLGHTDILQIQPWEMWKTNVLFDSQRYLFWTQGVTSSNVCKDS